MNIPKYVVPAEAGEGEPEKGSRSEGEAFRGEAQAGYDQKHITSPMFELTNLWKNKMAK